ncbi:hypothetical protein [Clostridium perfringens]|uniref:hypothetical protein n=1 Tax=Clostridium perfringens TaxID=1502 RepID=UPI0012410CC5|nr:hypothetical protein [Clostridium perfringens]MDU7724884.1 hypothetical protein [Clostridium perfringens]
MRLWRFENTDAVRENMEDEKIVKKLAIVLKIYIDSKEILLQIVEKLYGLKSGQISLSEIEILQKELKKKGYLNYARQFKQFGHLGFTPYVIWEV